MFDAVMLRAGNRKRQGHVAPPEILLDTTLLSAQNYFTMHVYLLDRDITLNMWWWDS